jgi:hypothetical protein
MKRFIIITALLLTTGQAGAAFYGSDYLKQLIDSCNALPETFDASAENFARVKDCGLSTGYILGVFDSLNVLADRSFCFPEKVQSGQVVATVENWMQNHPERMNQPADKSVRQALGDAWSCVK